MHKTDPKLMWKVTKGDYVSREPWFTVRLDSVETPTGEKIPRYHVLEYPNWVNVVAVTKDGKIVMVQQYRHGVGKVCFEIPAGVCEKEDATTLESAKRELLEETGYGNGKWELFSVISANPATHTNMAYTYLATDVEKISCQHLDAGEALTVHVFDKAEVLDMLKDGEIIQALMAAPLWKYFYLNKLNR